MGLLAAAPAGDAFSPGPRSQARSPRCPCEHRHKPGVLGTSQVSPDRSSLALRGDGPGVADARLLTPGTFCTSHPARVEGAVDNNPFHEPDEGMLAALEAAGITCLAASKLRPLYPPRADDRNERRLGQLLLP